MSTEVEEHSNDTGIVDGSARWIAMVIFWKWRQISRCMDGCCMLVETKSCQNMLSKPRLSPMDLPVDVFDIDSEVTFGSPFSTKANIISLDI